jgi:Leucine-rich repeat (LRR) protein
MGQRALLPRAPRSTKRSARSPGTVLRLTVDDAAEPRGLQLHSIIRSWHHPAAIMRLALGWNATVGCDTCCTIEALPNLLELSCGLFDPSHGCAIISPHTGLTSLHIRAAPRNLHDIPTYAPNLRSLHIEYMHRTSVSSFVKELFCALADMPCLQHLDVPFNHSALRLPSSFGAAMVALTGLTHLGLHHHRGQAGVDPMPPDSVQSFTQALAALPRLSSIKLWGIFSMLGPTLGAALQGPRLTSLELQHELWVLVEDPRHVPWLEAMHPPNQATYPPDIRTMDFLRHLVLSGREIFLGDCAQMLMDGGGNLSLRSLELADFDVTQLDTACDILACLYGLTSLNLKVTAVPMGHQEEPEATVRLTEALAQHSQLEHLEMCANLHGLLPCLAALSTLTSLGLSFSPRVLQSSDLSVVGTLSGLRKLSLEASNIQRNERGQCMRLVCSMPLLEEVQLQSGKWTEGEVAVLVPPAEALQRVVLGTPAGAAEACAALDAVRKLRDRAVDVTVKEQAQE